MISKNRYLIKSVYFIIYIVMTSSLISCGESKEMVRQHEIAIKEIKEEKKRADEVQAKKIAIAKESLNDLYIKYENLIDYSDQDNCELLTRAYNNPEENPEISNPSIASKNEFEYQRVKDLYKQTRSVKYLILGFFIDNRTEYLNPYDFINENFKLSFYSYTRRGPYIGYIYSDDKYNCSGLVVEKNQNLIISMPPDLAENFKEGITYNQQNWENGKGGYKDLVKIYVVFKVIGKKLSNKYQIISVEIVDYICYWFIDAGFTYRKNFTSWGESFEEIAHDATEIKVFKKK